MPNNPKANEEKMIRMVSAWRTLAPEHSFGGMTLAQFEAFAADPLEQRRTIEALEDTMTDALTTRDNMDETFLTKADLMVKAVVADPAFGDDSALYEALGYVRKSDRKSGLTRKKSEPQT